MKCILQTYTLKLVKESAHKYNVDKRSTSPSELYALIEEVLELSERPEENMYMLCMNVKNEITGIFHVSTGTICTAIVHPREVFKRAIACNSYKIALTHNHPSGDSTPSSEDINITNRLQEAGKIIGIEILDHIIVGSNGYCSLKEKGVL